LLQNGFINGINEHISIKYVRLFSLAGYFDSDHVLNDLKIETSSVSNSKIFVYLSAIEPMPMQT